MTTETTFCRICEALCGLEVTVEQNRVTEIRPDARHVATSGFACIKGLKQHKIYASPDRLRYPLRRDGRTFSRVSWDRAIAEIGAKVRRIREEERVGILLVEQNANLALAFAEEAYLLETGRIVVSGAAAEISKDESIRRSYLGY